MIFAQHRMDSKISLPLFAIRGLSVWKKFPTHITGTPSVAQLLKNYHLNIFIITILIHYLDIDCNFQKFYEV